jgi:hypothetical protein
MRFPRMVALAVGLSFIAGRALAVYPAQYTYYIALGIVLLAYWVSGKRIAGQRPPRYGSAVWAETLCSAGLISREECEAYKQQIKGKE